MSKKKPALIADVARLAGVSTATVSRVISNPEVVSERTREVVSKAIEATGYRPNEAARNLRSRRTGSIVAMVPDLGNPFFSKILSGIAAVLSPAGYNLLIVDTQENDPQRLASYASPTRADGLINLDGSLPAIMTKGRVPMVQVCEWNDDISAPKITIDNAKAMAIAVRHLASLGHKKIGHGAGKPENILSSSRLDGYRSALTELGLPLEQGFVFEGDFTLDAGKEAALIWLQMPEDTRPTAMCFCCDQMACGFISEVRRHGIKVPEDLSVIGFDDIELTSHITPPLTTIHQPRSLIGQIAAKSLLDLIEGKPKQDSLLEAALTLRESTSRPLRA